MICLFFNINTLLITLQSIYPIPLFIINLFLRSFIIYRLARLSQIFLCFLTPILNPKKSILSFPAFDFLMMSLKYGGLNVRRSRRKRGYIKFGIKCVSRQWLRRLFKRLKQYPITTSLFKPSYNTNDIVWRNLHCQLFQYVLYLRYIILLFR